jgi:hypothetical protein
VRFGDSDRDLLAATKEVEIETRSASGEVHRTVIWTAEHDGELYIRSYLGPRGRWYREAIADPTVTLIVEGRRIDALAIPATDDASIEACSAGLTAKYPRSQSLRAMLVDDVLPTTLRLEPVPAKVSA